MAKTARTDPAQKKVFHITTLRLQENVKDVPWGDGTPYFLHLKDLP